MNSSRGMKSGSRSGARVCALRYQCEGSVTDEHNALPMAHLRNLGSVRTYIQRKKSTPALHLNYEALVSPEPRKGEGGIIFVPCQQKRRPRTGVISQA